MIAPGAAERPKARWQAGRRQKAGAPLHRVKYHEIVMNVDQPSTVSTPADRRAALRNAVPRGAHAEWSPPAERPDPVQILIEQGRDRIQRLLPLRYARMKADPFAFLRGAAAVMAGDLAHTPASGLRVQSCGDCHLSNFGSYATPEGLPVFDVNDFDETLPAPFEWDVKRLAASLAVAGRVASYSESGCRKLAWTAVQSYHKHIGALAELSPFDAWSTRIDLVGAIAEVEEGSLRRHLQKRLDGVLTSGHAQFGLVGHKGGRWTIRDKPPLVTHSDLDQLHAERAFTSYAATLQEDRRVLLSRYALQDVAMKVVGVGSVGTFCALGLFVAADSWPLLLQVKEAVASVLAPYAGASAHANHGERVVLGQRMMQAASDIFLGWTETPIEGRHFYVRRLKDQRLADIGAMIEEALPFYAALCGRTLARAHARSGDSAAIADYLGRGSAFDEAVAAFAMAYADQTHRDWEAFCAAIDQGRILAAEQG
jgi:uncharacterized protein (DUF2252 family)